MNSDVTFISSFYRDLPLLVRNIEAVQMFNPKSEHKWIVINSSSNKDAQLDIESERIKLFKGIDDGIMKPFFIKTVSQANAAALDFGLRKADTRFVCVMDPDFFVTYPNWIEAITDYLKWSGVPILSAPYNPTWYEKAHRATGHFMFIDTETLPKALLTFAPSLRDHYHNNPRFNFPWNILKHIPRLNKWRQINWLYDCGSQIEEMFPFDIEYLTPIYDSDHNPRIDWLDKLTDNLRKPGRRIEEGEYPSIQVNYRDIFPSGEFYYWRGYPFAIHMRTFGSKILGQKDIAARVLDMVRRMYQGQKDIINQ